MAKKLKAPFPYFGGKSSVASLVWDRLGDVDNFIEPFCGSAAVLIVRPTPPRIETLNDADAYLANFWRATQHAPDQVAEHADWPVNEADLRARHRWLVLSEAAAEFRQRMRTDPHYFDARVAGWWVWGACCWIGGGWCRTPESAEHGGGKGGSLPGVHAKGSDKRGPAGGSGERSPKLNSEDGINSGSHGSGVHAKGPATWEQVPGMIGGCDVRGINSQVPDGNRPQLADAFSRGRGVHNDNHLNQQRPVLSDDMRGVLSQESIGTCAQRRAWLLDWFQCLRDRLRTVRVCCGHWLRVCDSESVTTRLGVTGLFLDPPYPTHAADGEESRAAGLYATDGSKDTLDQLRDEVLAYCLERGPNPTMRIAVCGYATDGYAQLEQHGWQVVAWKSQGGYSNRSKDNNNKNRERIWFSPGCLNQKTLFDTLDCNTGNG